MQAADYAESSGGSADLEEDFVDDPTDANWD
jgi:hypothetical protein